VDNDRFAAGDVVRNHGISAPQENRHLFRPGGERLSSGSSDTLEYYFEGLKDYLQIKK